MYRKFERRVENNTKFSHFIDLKNVITKDVNRKKPVRLLSLRAEDNELSFVRVKVLLSFIQDCISFHHD